MTQEHISVLLNESIDLLDIKPNGVYVDCTLGRAGHSVEILKRLKAGHLYAVDQDLEAIQNSEMKLRAVSNNFTILEGNFVYLKALLALKNINLVDGILYDLGVSSPQFDVGSRGFSYRFDSDLDMRMDLKNNKLTAKDIVNKYDLKGLNHIFKLYGEEQLSYQIAKKIIETRVEKPINTTFELVEIIKSALPQKILKQKKHPAKKVFQALRICVNDELEVLKKSLIQALELLKKDGVLVIISFHSLEEKIIKDIFKTKTTDIKDKFLSKLPVEGLIKEKEFKLLTKKPILPSDDELKINRRAHSAKLWAIKKVW
ncbi:16S rRNA (cytosine(1402)-N(4))-methyltransferase RsmH [Spiroplasma tabanidicola]|uniref:Ribosomal RNA small subunit methyltransferase H n=1 Tax=Spiroplasma tabanidicola TaxID=324079 RepID=A0A6I6C7G9_9MOLU|nr:16S rRNA (cytosine(1402)-N(4))-methyltransferase RsmH [Spiroplasma tabanidicola]QGS52160.1 S-adenosyl-methyltransferase MraW [Spiroplasma tabanidicola]